MDCHSVHLALAGPYLLTLKPNPFSPYFSAGQRSWWPGYLGSSSGSTIDNVTLAKTTSLLVKRWHPLWDVAVSSYYPPNPQSFFHSTELSQLSNCPAKNYSSWPLPCPWQRVKATGLVLGKSSWAEQVCVNSGAHSPWQVDAEKQEAEEKAKPQDKKCGVPESPHGAKSCTSQEYLCQDGSMDEK